MHRLDEAVTDLAAALTVPPRMPHLWRQLVGERLRTVDEQLRAERAVAQESWLTPRALHLHHERKRLLSRLAVLVATVAESPDLEAVRGAVHRFVQDVEHHHQRVGDLAYDALAMDVGGSE